MIRLNIIVEGQTEETFVNQLLSPHLSAIGIFPTARRIETGRKQKRIFRGGMTSYTKAKKDIGLWMNEDQGRCVRFTTMFDLYRLPRDFPGFPDAERESDPYRKIALLEERLGAEIASSRFIPYLQLHEYETLLFSELDAFHHYYPDHHQELLSLKQEVSGITNPEFINENPATAPSKRIIKYFPAYNCEKPSAGPIIAEKIGLQKIRSACRHFNDWLSQLELLRDHNDS